MKTRFGQLSLIERNDALNALCAHFRMGSQARQRLVDSFHYEDLMMHAHNGEWAQANTLLLGTGIMYCTSDGRQF